MTTDGDSTTIEEIFAKWHDAHELAERRAIELRTARSAETAALNAYNAASAVEAQLWEALEKARKRGVRR